MTATTATNDTIRRTASGSIDTAYYIDHSHTIRSRAAHESLICFVGTLKRLLSRKTVAEPVHQIPSLNVPAPRPMTRLVRTGRRFRSGWHEAEDALCMTCLSRPEDARKTR